MKNKRYLNNNTVGVTKHSLPQNGAQLYILNILILVLAIKVCDDEGSLIIDWNDANTAAILFPISVRCCQLY